VRVLGDRDVYPCKESVPIKAPLIDMQTQLSLYNVGLTHVWSLAGFSKQAEVKEGEQTAKRKRMNPVSTTVGGVHFKRAVQIFRRKRQDTTLSKLWEAVVDGKFKWHG
jgi:hypothetical protein